MGVWYQRALTCLQAFRTWWESCEDASAAKQRMRKALQRLRSVTLASALATWRSETSWGVHIRRMELQARVHFDRSLSRRMLQAWASHMREKQRTHLSVYMRTAVSRILHDELVCAFEDWRASSWELRRQRCILERAVARMQRRTLANTFLHYRGVVRWRFRGKRIVEAFHARSRRRNLVEVSDSLSFLWYSLCVHAGMHTHS